jgi:hypothetical protein
MVSRVVPMAARLVPLAAVVYTGHFLVAVTPLRLLCFPVDVSFTGVPRAPALPAQSLDFAEMVEVTPFNPVVLGHGALRFRLRDGVTHELMFPHTKDALPSQARFAAEFGPWVAGTARAGGFAGAPPRDPRVPPLAPRPLLGSWAMVVVGVLFALVNLVVAAGALSSASVSIGAMALLGGGLGAGLAWFGYRPIAERKRLRGVTPGAPGATTTTPAERAATKQRAALALGAMSVLMVLGAAVKFRDAATLQDDGAAAERYCVARGLATPTAGDQATYEQLVRDGCRIRYGEIFRAHHARRVGALLAAASVVLAVAAVGLWVGGRSGKGAMNGAVRAGG